MRGMILTLAVAVGMLLLVSTRLLLGRIGMDLLMGVCLVLFALFGVRSARRRTRWANTVFVAVVVVGLARWVAGSLIDSGVAVLELRTLHTVRVIQAALGGFFLGLIASLLLSGELLGRTSKQARGEQLAPPNSGPATRVDDSVVTAGPPSVS